SAKKFPHSLVGESKQIIINSEQGEKPPVQHSIANRPWVFFQKHLAGFPAANTALANRLLHQAEAAPARLFESLRAGETMSAHHDRNGLALRHSRVPVLCGGR